MKYSYHFHCELVLVSAGWALRWPRPCQQTTAMRRLDSRGRVGRPQQCERCYAQGDLLLSNFEQRFLAKILRNDFEI